MRAPWHIIDEHEVVWLIADHSTQRQLCTMLEGIADDLPNLPPQDAIDFVEQELSAYSQRHYTLEAKFFGRLADNSKSPTSEQIVKVIAQNHAIDAIHADDLAVELQRLSGASRACEPGQLAYMLRCFFDGCRRAIAFEELALLKLGGNRLTPAARQAVLRSLQAG